MKNLVILFVLVLSTTKVSAQFFNPYCNPYMAEVQANVQMRLMENAQLAQMRAQTMQMQMQYMQMLQARSAAAYNNMMNFQYTPTVPPVQTPTTITTREKVTCSSCGGSGRVTRNKPSYSQKRTVTVREICSECHGKGYNRE